MNITIRIIKGLTDEDWKIYIYENVREKYEIGSEDITITPRVPSTLRRATNSIFRWVTNLFDESFLSDFFFLHQDIEKILKFCCGEQFTSSRSERSLETYFPSLTEEKHLTVVDKQKSDCFKNTEFLYTATFSSKNDYEEKFLSIFRKRNDHICDLRTLPAVANLLTLSNQKQKDILAITSGQKNPGSAFEVLDARKVCKPYKRFQTLTTPEKTKFLINELNSFFESYKHLVEPKKKNDACRIAILYFLSFKEWFTQKDEHPSNIIILPSPAEGCKENTDIEIKNLQNLLGYLNHITKPQNEISKRDLPDPSAELIG